LNYLDIIIFAILLIGFLLGYKDGLVRKLIGLIGLIVAVYLAFTYSDEFGIYLNPIFNNEDYLANFFAGLIIFIIAIFVFSIIKRLVHPLDKVNRFFNQLFGGIAGAIQTLFFISGFLLFLNIFGIPDQEDRGDSMVFNQVYSIVPTVIDFTLGSDSTAKDFIEDYIERKENFALPELQDTSFIKENQSDTL